MNCYLAANKCFFMVTSDLNNPSHAHKTFLAGTMQRLPEINMARKLLLTTVPTGENSGLLASGAFFFSSSSCASFQFEPLFKLDPIITFVVNELNHK